MVLRSARVKIMSSAKSRRAALHPERPVVVVLFYLQRQKRLEAIPTYVRFHSDLSEGR